MRDQHSVGKTREKGVWELRLKDGWGQLSKDPEVIWYRIGLAVGLGEDETSSNEGLT